MLHYEEIFFEHTISFFFGCFVLIYNTLQWNQTTLNFLSLMFKCNISKIDFPFKFRLLIFFSQISLS